MLRSSKSNNFQALRAVPDTTCMTLRPRKILLFLPQNSCLWGFSSLNLVIKIEMKYFFLESVGLFRKGGLFTLISNVYKKDKTIKICFNLEFSNLFYNFLKYKVSTPQGFFQAFFISGKQFKLSFKNSVYD